MDTTSAQALLQAAEDALQNEQYEAAASYADSVIEHDQQNDRAWLLRAAAAAGGATVADSRLEEAVNAWMTALHFVKENAASAVREEIAEQFSLLLQNELRRRAGPFAGTPDAEHLELLLRTLSDGLRLQNLLTIQGGLSFDRSEQYTRTARLLCDAAVSGFDTAAKAFGPTPGNMQLWQWEKFTDEGDNCLRLLERAVHFCRDSDLGKNICDHYMRFGEAIKSSCAWRYDENSATGDAFVRDRTFTAGARHIREDDIRRFRTIRGYFEADETNRLCRELAAFREDADTIRARNRYWEDHAEEKKALEAESEKLNADVAQAELSLQTLPVTQRLQNTNAEISRLEAERASLGFGAKKRKKEIKITLETLTQTAATLSEEETTARNALIWTEKKSRARIAEIKRIFAAKRGVLPAPAGSFCLSGDGASTALNVSPQQLCDHLSALIPPPFRIAGLLPAKRFDVAPAADFSGLGPMWALLLEKNVADIATSAMEPQVFFAAKSKTTPITAVVFQCAAAQTADEEALLNFGIVGSLLLLSLLRHADQEAAERIILELRHGSDNTKFIAEGLRMEYMSTELLQPDGTLRYRDHVLIRTDAQNNTQKNEKE